MKQKLLLKAMLLLCALIAGSSSVWATDVTINFGTTTNYWAAHTNDSFTDSDSRVWSRTCSVSNMSGQASYSQFGNASNTCGSLEFTATAGSDITVTAFSVKMAGASGGNSPTKGTIYLYKKSGDTETEIASASVSGTDDVTCSISSSQSFSSTDILKVSYVGTAKAIRIKQLTYSYTTGSGGLEPSISLGTTTVNAPETAVSTTTINVTYNNLTNYDADVIFYESDGTTAATYDHSWITAGINATTMNLDYSITANTGAARTAYLRVYAMGDEGDAESGLITITQAKKTVASPEFNLEGGSYMQGTNITISSEGNTVYYNLTTDGSTPGNPTNTSTEYTAPIVLGSGKTIIKAIAYDTYGNASGVTTRTYTGIALASLPFSWTGTSSAGKAKLAEETGVVVNLGSDYATSNAPYRLKFDGEGKYVIIYTNAKPENVYFTVKLLGGKCETGSKIKVQGSADGITFDDIEEFTMKGAANATFEFATSNAFAATHRAVKLVMSSKDQNVAVGTICVSCIPVTIGTTGWATLSSAYALDFEHASPAGLSAYMVTGASGTAITKSAVTNVPANTGLLLNGAAGDYTIPVLASSSTVVSANKMKACVTATTVKYNDNSSLNYVLANNGGTAEFQKIVSGTYGSVNISAGKAYLALTDDPGAPTLSIDFGDANGINTLNVERETLNGEVYNLAGQRVAQPTKGLYIVNGKKVIVK